MQLTEQNFSRQLALMYIENLCTKMVQIIRKTFNMSSIVLYIYYSLYLTFQLNTLTEMLSMSKYFKNLPLDLLLICRNC